MLANTRTTRSNGFVRWLAWQMPYHCEHHVFPTVPFHALKATHKKIVGKLGATSKGYAAFNRQYLRRMEDGSL
jgi:fatty acid desaturase